MKNVFIVLAAMLILISCNNSVNQVQNLSENNYFKKADTGMQTGGVKIVSIQTPKGKFNVWTKQFGNNPKIKLLLLNGGPGGLNFDPVVMKDMIKAGNAVANDFIAALNPADVTWA